MPHVVQPVAYVSGVSVAEEENRRAIVRRGEEPSVNLDLVIDFYVHVFGLKPQVVRLKIQFLLREEHEKVFDSRIAGEKNDSSGQEDSNDVEPFQGHCMALLSRPVKSPLDVIPAKAGNQRY